MIEPVKGPVAARQSALVRARQDADSVPVIEPVAPIVVTRLDRRAAYLAQLLAARDGLPQARARRRAEPQEAADAYRGMARRLASVDPRLAVVA